MPGLGRSPGEGKGYPLQYSGLENSMDNIVHGVTKSHTRLSDFHFHFITSASFNICWFSFVLVLSFSAFIWFYNHHEKTVWRFLKKLKYHAYVSCSVVSNSLGIHFPWDFAGMNTGVGCHFLLRMSLWPRDQTRISCVSFIAGQFFAWWATQKAEIPYNPEIPSLEYLGKNKSKTLIQKDIGTPKFIAALFITADYGHN